MLKKNTAPWLFIALFFSSVINAQDTEPVIALLKRLDSVRNSSSISRHFAEIYFQTTVNAVHFFSAADIKVQHLMERMETGFAGYFFRSANAYADNQVVPGEWKAYYKDKNAPSLQYILFGINAHINGDIWQALTNEFSQKELDELKTPYFLYYKQLLKEYRRVYESALASNRKMRLLHTFSFGLDELYGKILLKRWRKRQMQLAGLYFTDRSLFEKKRKKLQRKMDHLDQLIRRNV